MLHNEMLSELSGGIFGQPQKINYGDFLNGIESNVVFGFMVHRFELCPLIDRSRRYLYVRKNMGNGTSTERNRPIANATPQRPI
jgi:hypothetical protein